MSHAHIALDAIQAPLIAELMIHAARTDGDITSINDRATRADRICMCAIKNRRAERKSMEHILSRVSANCLPVSLNIVNEDRLPVDILVIQLRDAWTRLVHIVATGGVLKKVYLPLVEKLADVWSSWRPVLTFHIHEIAAPLIKDLKNVRSELVRAAIDIYEQMFAFLCDMIVGAAINEVTPFSICSQVEHINATMRMMLDLRTQFMQQADRSGTFVYKCAQHIDAELVPGAQVQKKTGGQVRKKKRRRRKRRGKAVAVEVEGSGEVAAVVAIEVEGSGEVKAEDSGEGSGEVAADVVAGADAGADAAANASNAEAEGSGELVKRPSKSAMRYRRKAAARQLMEDNESAVAANRARALDICDGDECKFAAVILCSACGIHSCSRCYIRAIVAGCPCGAVCDSNYLISIMVDAESTWAEASANAAQCFRCFRFEPGVELRCIEHGAGKTKLMVCTECVVFRLTIQALQAAVSEREIGIPRVACEYLSASRMWKIMV